MGTFGVASIDPISLQLLNMKLPDGTFLIPTPHAADGRVTGTAVSTYHEKQLNTNFDYRVTAHDLLSVELAKGLWKQRRGWLEFFTSRMASEDAAGSGAL